MKKYYLICLMALLGCMLAMPGRVMADSGKALLVNDGKYLFFVYDDNTYNKGDFYKYGYITAVTTGIEDKSFDADNVNQWGGPSSVIQQVYFESGFNNCHPRSLRYWFHGFTTLGTSASYYIHDISRLNLSEAEDLHGAFYDCTNLRELDVSGWFTTGNSVVTDLGSTFYGCKNLSALNVSNWDVSHVTTLESTFMRCEKITSLDMSKWYTRNVTNMNSTFSGCKALTYLPVDTMRVSNVTDLKATFSECENLATLNVSNWDVSKVTTLESTFEYLGKSNSTNFTLDVSSWNVGNVTTLKNTFHGCQKISSLGSTALRNWNVSKVTDMYQTFASCNQLTALDVSQWTVNSVTTLYSTFYQCSMLAALDVTNWNVGNVETLYGTFQGCSRLLSLPVGSWTVNKVANMESTFNGCSSLTTLPVNASGDYWNVSNVTTLEKTFQGCSGLTSLPVDNWNVSNVTTLNGTFSSCSRLTTLNVDGWKDKLGKVEFLSNTFYGCSSLTTLSINNWNVSNVMNMSGTFQGCSGLKRLDVYGWDMRNVTTTKSMFESCSSLTSLSFGANYSRSNIGFEGDVKMFKECPKLRYIDFYDSNFTHTITGVDRSSYSQFQGVPETTVIYLPKKSADVTNVRNVVYSYNENASDLRCPNYYSEDKVDIEFPRDFLTNKAEYYREMTTTYGSVILPYDFTTDSYVQAYTLDEEHIPTMYFKDTETVSAHTPFAYKKLTTAEFRVSGDYVPKFGAQFINEDPDENFSITVYATHTTSHEEEMSAGTPGTPYTADTNLTGWDTKGYYINETVECDGNDYSGVFYISGDKFYEADGPLTLYPHRVTFHGIWEKPIPGSSNYGTTGTRTFEITTVSDSQIADAIDAAELRMTEREASDIYDVQGRRHSAMQRGINIVRMKDGSVRKTMVK